MGSSFVLPAGGQVGRVDHRARSVASHFGSVRPLAWAGQPSRACTPSSTRLKTSNSTAPEMRRPLT